MRKHVISLAAAMVLGMGTAYGAGDRVIPEEQEWSWTGYFGSFDRASAQRGLQVYQEVCASCHSLKRVAYRNLMEIGYTEDQVKEIAAEAEVLAGPDEEGEILNEDGELRRRPGIPADRFVSPFLNDDQARAANEGAMPPDLSLIVKARAGNYGNIPLSFAKWMQGRGTATGADYVYGLLTGYLEPEEAEAWERERFEHGQETGHIDADAVFEHKPISEDKYYNKYFPGHAIGMAAPLDDEAVEYEDGTEATLEQHARDISTFLAWASEPELEQRKDMGWKVILFLVFLLGLTIAAKRQLWRNVKK